jgi:carboxypeptidase C (cathepsin A)
MSKLELTGAQREARDNSSTVPTTISLPGGPGTSFLDGARGFPCSVYADSNSSTLNLWSSNNVTNMLYIDTPVGTGYSYTEPQKGLLDLFSGELVPVQDEVTSSETLPTN